MMYILASFWQTWRFRVFSFGSIILIPIRKISIQNSSFFPVLSLPKAAARRLLEESQRKRRFQEAKAKAMERIPVCFGVVVFKFLSPGRCCPFDELSVSSGLKHKRLQDDICWWILKTILHQVVYKASVVSFKNAKGNTESWPYLAMGFGHCTNMIQYVISISY